MTRRQIELLYVRCLHDQRQQRAAHLVDASHAFAGGDKAIEHFKELQRD
jgi:hypothetical protein